MPARDPADAERASVRLASEATFQLSDFANLPLDIAGETYHPSALLLRRWGSDGRKGIYLDTTFCRFRQAWVTSREALNRFSAAVREQAPAAAGH